MTQETAASNLSCEKDGLSEQQLMQDFFRTAIDFSSKATTTSTDELEKVQLQKAIAALSEKLLLF